MLATLFINAFALAVTAGVGFEAFKILSTPQHPNQEPSQIIFGYLAAKSASALIQLLPGSFNMQFWRTTNSDSELSRHPAIAAALDQQAAFLIFMHPTVTNLPDFLHLDHILNAFWLLPTNDVVLSWWQAFELIEAKIGFSDFPSDITAGLAPPNFTAIGPFLNTIDPTVEYQDHDYIFVVKIAKDHSNRAAVYDFLYDYACATQMKIACFDNGISVEPSRLDVIGFMALCAHNWRKRHSKSFILYLDTTKESWHDEIAKNASYEAYFVYLVPPLWRFKTTSLTDLYQPNSPWPFPLLWPFTQPLLAALESQRPCSLITTFDNCEVVRLFEFLPKQYPSCHVLILPTWLNWVDWLSLAKDNVVPLAKEAIERLRPRDFTAVEIALTQWAKINDKPVLYHNARYIFFIFLPQNASQRSAIVELLNPFQNNSLALKQNKRGIALEPCPSPTFELFITQWLQCYHQPNAELFYLFHEYYSPLATVVKQKGGQVIQLTKPPEADQTSQNLLVEISNFVSDR